MYSDMMLDYFMLPYADKVITILNARLKFAKNGKWKMESKYSIDLLNLLISILFLRTSLTWNIV